MQLFPLSAASPRGNAASSTGATGFLAVAAFAGNRQALPLWAFRVHRGWEPS